jgi:hypothetical protein
MFMMQRTESNVPEIIQEDTTTKGLWSIQATHTAG